MDKAFFPQLTLVVTQMITWVYLTVVSVKLSPQPQHQEGFTEQLEYRVHQRGSTLDEALPHISRYRKWLDKKVQYCDVLQNRCTVFTELTLDPLISYPYGWTSPGLNRNYLQNAVFYQKQKAVQKVKFYLTDLDTRIVNLQINMHHFTQSTNASILIVDRKAQVPNAGCFMMKNDAIEPY